MDSITAVAPRTLAFGPVPPVSAARPVTRDGTGRVTLLPDSFLKLGRPAPSVTYGRQGTGGT